MNRFFITTPIYYVNAKPHLGHAYTTVAADCLARLARLSGRQTFFLTGVDEHGDKIVQAAEAAGQTPKEYVDGISALFRDLWPRLGVAPSRFIRTTDPEHKKAVQLALRKVYDKGDIYFGDYGGHYCYGCERFLTDKELVEGGLCPDHKTKPRYIAEKNYFFRMSAYQDRLLDHIRANPDFIRPRQYRSEVTSLLESGALEDLCISRPTTRLTWGVPLPFDENYVTYVWFDALINYISALGWPDGPEFAAFWPHAEHLVAKDILKPHAIFWPTMLMALDLPLYRHLNVHGYWLAREAKMSKSLGNVVDPLALAEKAGLDGMRYFFLREMTFGSDASYSDEAFLGRFNADLANDLGNLMNRTLAMVHKYFGGTIPAPADPAAAPAAEADRELATLGREALANYLSLFSAMQPSRALEALWELIRAGNRYIDGQAPWTLFKEGRLDRLAEVLSLTVTALSKAALFLWPVMPTASEAMLGQLGRAFDPDGADLGREVEDWGGPTGPLGVAASSTLFPRIEAPKKDEPASAPKKAPTPQTAPKAAKAEKTPSGPVGPAEAIDFEDFARLDLRVGRILSADPVPGADRLYLVGIDIGEPEPRQVVAGLAEHFKPEELVGLQATMVANLKPRKLKGVESRGMILAVKDAAGLRLLTPTAEVRNGSKVS